MWRNKIKIKAISKSSSKLYYNNSLQVLTTSTTLSICVSHYQAVTITKLSRDVSRILYWNQNVLFPICAKIRARTMRFSQVKIFILQSCTQASKRPRAFSKMGLKSFFRYLNPNLCQLKNEIFTSENFHPTIFQPGFKEA